MSKAIVHSASSARKFGGKPEDYLAIHNFMDSSKGALSDNRHRAILHSSFACAPGGIIEMAFGVTITNSDGKEVSTRDIAEMHILEDFGNRFIPSLQDWLGNMPIEPWMSNSPNDVPPSHKNIRPKKKLQKTARDDEDVLNRVLDRRQNKPSELID